MVDFQICDQVPAVDAAKTAPFVWMLSLSVLALSKNRVNMVTLTAESKTEVTEVF